MRTVNLSLTLVLLIGVGLSCGDEKPSFDGDNAFRYLVAQVDFGPRNPGSPGHARALEYLTSELRSVADSVRLQPFTFVDSATGGIYDLTNVIASFNPQMVKRVLVGAHWDTRPRADMDLDPSKRDTPILGANDGASGVAVLLELARILEEQPPPVGVDLVLFDGEDYGLSGDLDNYCLGSKYFARNTEGYKPDWAIIVDMVGDIDLNIPIERNSYKYNKKLVDRVWTAAERAGSKQFKRSLGDYIYDDHLILIEEAGFEAVDIIDFDYSYGARNYWHTTEDTPDKCSPESLRAVGQTLIEMIY